MTNVAEDRVKEEIRQAIKIDADAVRGHLDELDGHYHVVVGGANPINRSCDN